MRKRPSVANFGGCRAWSVLRTAAWMGRRLEAFTLRRRVLARRYFERFDRSLGCELPLEDFEHSNWHMFQIVLPAHIERGDFIRAMHAAGIGVGVHYPAIH